jgi:hypothetical protein
VLNADAHLDQVNTAPAVGAVGYLTEPLDPPDPLGPVDTVARGAGPLRPDAR